MADDIPLARRSHSLASERSSTFRPGLIWLALLVFTLSAAALAALMGPLRGLFQQPVPGVEAQLSNDGRLLGHFPYPEAPASQLVMVAPGMELRAEAAKSFLAMKQAAEADGVTLSLISAFRSKDEQQQLFFTVKAERNQTALDRAKVSAPPGFSEHSTGYAVDIGDARQPQTNLSNDFMQTSAYRWLVNNAARYQFALSFPQNNPQGVSFEPWHWRYEGSTDALRVFEPAQRLRRGSKP